MGVDLNQTIALTFLLGGALAGAAGVVWGLRFGFVRFDLGFNSGLKAFTAAVLGGIGNITGAALGGFIIGFIENFAASLGYSRWSEFLVFMVLTFVLDLQADRHPRPAARETGHDRDHVAPGRHPPRRRRRARGCATSPSTIARSTIIVGDGDRHRPDDRPADGSRRFSVVQSEQPVVRRVRERRRLRPPRDGPQRRRRPGRPARPRLRGVLRDRRVHLRLRELAVLRPWTCRSCRCSSSARAWRPSFGIALGAPTLRLRGDYLAIMTLGFGEIVPIVFLNLRQLHRGDERHRRDLPAGAAARARRVHAAHPVAVLHPDGRDRHGRDDPALPAPGFPDRPGLDGDPRGRAGGRGQRHQHGHHQAPRVRPRRHDRRAWPASSTPRS